MNQAIALYHKAYPLSEELAQEELALLAYLYCNAIFRHTYLLFAIWSAKGWGAPALSTLLQPSFGHHIVSNLLRADESGSNLEQWSTVAGINRSLVSMTLSQAHGPWLLHLCAADRLTTIQLMAGVYACLGFKRKEAFILREVLSCIMDLIACSRVDEYGSSSRASLSKGLGITDGDSSTASVGAIGVRAGEGTEGNESVLRILRYVCKVFGLDLELVKLSNVQESDRDELPACNDDIDLAHEPFGWLELQVGVIREAIAVAEALPGLRAYLMLWIELNVLPRLCRCC